MIASLLPKCDELDRMADALSGALERRSQVLRLSKDMHQQIHAEILETKANNWCHRGVELLTTIPYDCTAGNAASALTTVDKYIEEGESLKVEMLDIFNNEPNLNKLIMLTTTETSTLLAQVAERIDDMRHLSISRRDALQKMALREIRKPPVQVVSPEKLQCSNGDQCCTTISTTTINRNSSPTSPNKTFATRITRIFNFMLCICDTYVDI
ncbi:unnamed protein product [Brugia pahangi]|uniref:IMD domain-containing protein n=1 Tax=Brugia pahangi TaxID=6280 RepID=A0A0N4TTD9_BRUPA|nr:unnamed protein product [Brugia pahangi]